MPVDKSSGSCYCCGIIEGTSPLFADFSQDKIYVDWKGREERWGKDENKKMAKVQENACIGINLSKHF